MRTFSIKSLTLAVALTLTLVATPSFAAGRQDRDRTVDRRGTITRIIDAVRRLFGVTVNDLPIVPLP